MCVLCISLNGIYGVPKTITSFSKLINFVFDMASHNDTIRQKYTHPISDRSNAAAKKHPPHSSRPSSPPAPLTLFASASLIEMHGIGLLVFSFAHLKSKTNSIERAPNRVHLAAAAQFCFSCFEWQNKGCKRS